MVEEYVTFKDLFNITWVVIVAAISLYGYIVYRFLSERIRGQARSEAENEKCKMGAHMLLEVGFIYWADYKISKNNEYLNLAIRITEKAYDDYGSHLDDSENELLICNLKNNLAYYYAARTPIRLEDGVKARQYAKYILNESHEFEVSKRDEMINTYQYVQQRFPKSQVDIYLNKPFLKRFLKG